MNSCGVSGSTRAENTFEDVRDVFEARRKYWSKEVAANVAPD